jgi:hypothetical protein
VVFGITGTASVFLWGAVGGLTTQLVANVALVLQRQFLGKHSTPKRFKTFMFWFGVAGSSVLGGLIAWSQGDALVNSHQLAWQIGLAWPALLGVTINKQETPPPGSASWVNAARFAWLSLHPATKGVAMADADADLYIVGAVNPAHAEGLQYHVLPTDDPLRALNILREAAGLQPISDEHDH